MEWDYSILDQSGYQIAKISKELLRMTDTYVIDVQDPENTLDALMFVLAIDAKNVPEIKWLIVLLVKEVKSISNQKRKK
ncbi:MAG: hypothetical protein ACLT9M_13450 [Anaerobutyricum hallii]